MQATYTKLKSGAWGVRVNSESVRKGQSITVAKKDGSTKTETIAAVVWHGNGISLCAIAQREPSYDRGSSLSSVERTYMRKYGWDGVRGSSSYYTSGMYDEES